MKSEVTARAAAMGYCSDQLNGVQEARRVRYDSLNWPQDDGAGSNGRCNT